MSDAPPQTILVVDDEPAIQRALRAGLEARGYRVLAAATGQQAIDMTAVEAPALVVLDLNLPDVDGVEVCRRIRGWTDVPIVVLSAEGSESRKVLALDEGADDYVTKPFSMPELLARVRVALRHRPLPGAGAGAARDQAVLEVGDIRVDVPRHQVTVGGRAVELTPKEFAFLALLARWPGRVLTHRTILREVWGPEYGTETQYLRVYASQLRKKLDDDPERPRLVTEPGVGYRLVEPAGSPTA
ncbi:MAG: two-component system, OmpR family, operon response regulator KdpE [Actinomycetota bacterium]|jgi:two-component system KDP operon response regulator KdpE|nr:two-component system, OmpR family, operon response regulator KdpE [Actinomycetota bacterium]